jgi:hypothetical protein
MRPEKTSPAGQGGAGVAALEKRHAGNRDYTPPACFGRITATQPGRLSKRYTLAGERLNKAPGGNLQRGHFERLAVTGPAELAAIVEALTPAQALTAGTAAPASAPIACRKLAAGDVLTRTRQDFYFPAAPGWLVLDYDAPPGQPPMPREELAAMLRKVCPELVAAPGVGYASASGHIYTQAGEQLRGAAGWHWWALVADAVDIPRAGLVLFERLWLAGCGFYLVSESGALLKRGPVDSSVWQPERLIFAAGADCGPGLMQRRPPVEILNPEARPLDTRETLPDLTQAERRRLAEIEQAEAAKVEPERQRKRAEWAGARLADFEQRNAATLASKPPAEAQHIREQARARFGRVLDSAELPGDFLIYPEWGAPVTVAEILAEPERWDGRRCADPLEPGYRNDRRVGHIATKAEPLIYSHAHGGQRFRLAGAGYGAELQAAALRASWERMTPAGWPPMGRKQAARLVLPLIEPAGTLVGLLVVAPDGAEAIQGRAGLVHIAGPIAAGRVLVCPDWQRGAKVAELEPAALVLAAPRPERLAAMATAARNAWPGADVAVMGDEETQVEARAAAIAAGALLALARLSNKGAAA